MERALARAVLGLAMSLVLTNAPAKAQWDRGFPPAEANPAVALGPPSIGPEPSFGSFDDGAIYRHEVRQFSDLPPLDVAPPAVIAPLPPPDIMQLTPPLPKNWTVDYVYIGPGGFEDGPGKVAMSQVGVRYMTQWPITDRWRLVFRPNVDILFLSGPVSEDPRIPEQLYQVSFDLSLDYRLTDRWGISVGVTPGLWTDFVVVTGDDFRIPARILLSYQYSESLFLVAGLIYTDNIRANLFPGFGVIWSVNDRWTIDLIWPRLRSAYSLHEDLEFYFAFEAFYETYDIRIDELDENMEYRDWRILIGADIGLWETADLFVETGIALRRRFRFEFQSDRDVGEGFFLRVGTRF